MTKYVVTHSAMASYALVEDDGCVLQLAPAGPGYAPGVLRLTGCASGDALVFSASSIPTLVRALASAWREADPDDANARPDDAWLHDVPRLHDVPPFEDPS